MDIILRTLTLPPGGTDVVYSLMPLTRSEKPFVQRAWTGAFAVMRWRERYDGPRRAFVVVMHRDHWGL